jgi:hypothetical protein
MSASPDHAWLWPWLRERVLASWYLLVPLALFITLAGGVERWFSRTTTAFLGIVAFRLWDDVEDLAHDRRHHPTRVLCRLSFATAPYRLALFGLAFTAASIARTGGVFSLSMFLGAVAVSYGAFEVRSAWPHQRGLLAHVLLLKVPALALALALPDTPPVVAWGNALSLYGIVSGYELAHDAAARKAPFAPVLALVALGCLFAGCSVWIYPAYFP